MPAERTLDSLNRLHATVIGGGLAGSEAAWQLADGGFSVSLYEMRPAVGSPAHHSDDLAELVCSNSLKSTDPTSAAGALKFELQSLGSHLLETAVLHAVPAGGALAVDRDTFASAVTEAITAHPNITVLREEAISIPLDAPCIIASGPLTSERLDTALSDLLGADRLSFYDAAAPIVSEESLDRGRVFEASRYDKGQTADYLNCPMDRNQYEAFIAQLLGAERVTAKEFESADLFAACQPIEELARKGLDAPRFGPLKPVGLVDPSTGQRPWAVVQLRAENRAGTAYNLVGFQTNLTFPEQRRVFSMLPGLEHADFLRLGVMHRNTFVDSPRLLDSTLALRDTPSVRIAGQLAGTEGYTEAIATGLLAARNLIAQTTGGPPLVLPSTTALGSLIAYATAPETKSYQPMHVNWGLVPPLSPPVKGKRPRYAAYADRARNDLATYLDTRTQIASGGADA